MSDVVLGCVPSDDAKRDAIHVAVVPMVAIEMLRPGQKVGIVDGGAGPTKKAIGIVDPYLDDVVPKGHRFWLCLFPNTVTEMRHEWSHPAFDAPAKSKAEARRWMEEFASKHYSHRNEWYSGFGRSYTADDLIEAGREFLLTGEHHVQQGSESLRDEDIEEFWKNFEVLTGMEVPEWHKGETPFSCSC